MKPGKDYLGVGCGAIIFNEKNEIILMKRTDKKKSWSGLWSRPGGAVEHGETIEEAIIRETKEETGIDIELLEYSDMTQEINPEDGTHWIAIGYLAKYVSGELKNLEPEKHEVVGWFSLDNLPEPITQNTLNGIENFKKELSKK